MADMQVHIEDAGSLQTKVQIHHKLSQTFFRHAAAITFGSGKSCTYTHMELKRLLSACATCTKL